MTGGQSTDDKFKKMTQVVGSDHQTVGNINDEIMRKRDPMDNFSGDQRSADEGRQRQLDVKGRDAGHVTDQQIEDYKEMKAKLDKRGNEPQ